MRKLIFILLVPLVIACGEETKEGKQKKRVGPVQSAPYELLVVCDKSWFDSEAGAGFKDFVNSKIEGMPQDESIFKVICINHEGFSKTYSVFGCIIFVHLGQEYKKAEVRYAKNVYARPQVVITINAPDSKAFDQLIEDRGQAVIDRCVDNEMGRSVELLRKDYSGIVDENARKLFGCSWHVPSQINMIKTAENFFWASSPDNTYNACMYSYPLAADAMTKENFCHNRDSAMYFNIEGEEWGQHMETDTSTVRVRERLIEGEHLLEVRGLWDMKNDAMGGPFVAYARPDSNAGKMIVTEGFVYLPNKSKKKQIHSLEAALRTLKKVSKHK